MFKRKQNKTEKQLMLSKCFVVKFLTAATLHFLKILDLTSMYCNLFVSLINLSVNNLL